MTEDIDYASALMRLNDWLGRTVQAMVVTRDGAPPDALPPSRPADGWHVVLVCKGTLGRPPARTDFERQLSIGAYSVGDGDLLMLLDELPCERILALEEPERLAFYLADSPVVLSVSLLEDP